MKTLVFDIECSSLYSDTGIVLAFVGHEYATDKPPIIIRADEFKTWKNNRSNTRPIVEKILEVMEPYDIFVAHNGNFFDKPYLVSFAIKYNLPAFLRFAKFIDPVMLARRHMRLSRRSLGNVLQFLEIPEEKTAILWAQWMRATIEGDRKALGYITDHCVRDVEVLEKAYDKMRKLVKGIDEKGSSF